MPNNKPLSKSPTLPKDHMVNENVGYKDLRNEWKKQAKKIANYNADADSSSDESIPSDFLGTRRPSDSTGNNLEKLPVSNKNLAFLSSKGVEVSNERQNRYVYHTSVSSYQARMYQEFVYKYPPTPKDSSYVSILSQRQRRTEATEGSANQPIYHIDICSDDCHTTFDSQEDNSTGMPGSMINETSTDASSDESLSDEKQMTFHKSPIKYVGDFKQGYHEEQKIQSIVVTTKSGGYERQFMKRQQPHATMESVKTKIQTEEDKLGNRHTYPDHMVTEEVWYKYLWRECKKQAKKIANSNADADTSSDESIHVGDFKLGRRKQRKMQTVVVAPKSGGYKRKIINRQQLHATVESEKQTIQTKEDKLGNHHNDPDHMVNEKVWYKYLWRKLKRQAKKIANSNADEDSSSYNSMSIETHATKRPSDSTRNKLEKNFVSDKNVIFPHSKGVKIESGEKVSDSKKTAPDVFPHNSSPKQDRLAGTKLPVDITSISEKTLKELAKLKDSAADKRTFDPRDTRRPSDSTGNNLEKFVVSNTNLAFRTSKGVEVNIESQKRDTYKIDLAVQTGMILESDCVYTYSLTPSVSSNASIPNQNRGNEESEVTCVQLELQEKDKVDQEEKESKATSLMPERILSILSNYWAKEISKNASDKLFHGDGEHVRFKRIKNRSNHVRIFDPDHNTKYNPTEDKGMSEFLNAQKVYKDFAAEDEKMKERNQDRNNEEVHDTHAHQKENKDEEEEVEEKLQENGADQVTSEKLEMHNKMDHIPDEDRNNEEVHDTHVHQKENKDEEEEVEEKLQENWADQVTSERLEMLTTLDQIQEERDMSTEASEGSVNSPIHHTDICSDDHHTALDSQEYNNTGMPGSMVNENGSKIQAKQISMSEDNTDASSNESLSAAESTMILLYRNVIRNETYRMMSSIDMVMSEAEHLFGLERSQSFFDLLDEELCHFGSAGAISNNFVPNMAESIVRQHVISFFEHSRDMINTLITLLLRCPDSNILQQMPLQNFISLIKSVIKSSLNSTTNGKEKLSLEGNKYTMVVPKDFERSLGEEIPEDVLNRLKSGDEMVVHRFVDTRLERPQPSDRSENKHIHSIYFPSDCRLFISIPTENRIYWHQLDMRRADRISRQSK